MRDRLRGDPNNIRKEIVLNDDLSRLIPLFDESKSSGQKYGDNIVQWLFKGDEPIGEKLEEWINYKEDRKRLGMELFKIIQAEFHRLETGEAVEQNGENMCRRRYIRKLRVTSHSCQSGKKRLRRRKVMIRYEKWS